jgi:hypothetical protein
MGGRRIIKIYFLYALWITGATNHYQRKGRTPSATIEDTENKRTSFHRSRKQPLACPQKQCTTQVSSSPGHHTCQLQRAHHSLARLWQIGRARYAPALQEFHVYLATGVHGDPPTVDQLLTRVETGVPSVKNSAVCQPACVSHLVRASAIATVLIADRDRASKMWDDSARARRGSWEHGQSAAAPTVRWRRERCQLPCTHSVRRQVTAEPSCVRLYYYMNVCSS